MAPLNHPSEEVGLGKRIERFFHAEEVPYGVALVRMFLPIGMLVAMVPRWFHARELYSSDGATTPLAHGYGIPNMLPEFSGVIAVGMATLLLFTLITTCIGWCTRASLLFAFLAYTYLNLTDAVSSMTKYSVISSHVLLLLSMSQCGAVWSVDRWLERRRRSAAGLGELSAEPKFAAWPRRLMQLLIGIVYFGSAMTKFHTPAYFTSDQLSTWMQTNVNFANPMGEWMTQYTSLIVVFAYVAVVWEILFVFMCWRGTARVFMLGLGVLFHVMTTVTLGLVVFPIICISIYFAFLGDDDIRRITGWLRRKGLLRSEPKEQQAAAPPRRRGSLPIPSPIAFVGVAVIVAAIGIEIEYWRDPYGLRRPEGPYALKEIDPELVEQTYFKKSGPVLAEDTIASFQAGTIVIGGELFNPKREFRIGETMIVQATVSAPHSDMPLDCALHDADDHVVDSNPLIATREMRRCNFYYTLSKALEPGEYALVLKRTGRELLRRRITIRASKNSAAAN